MSEVSYGFTLGGTYQFSRHFLTNLNVTYGKINAKDAKNGPRWINRNLDFSSNIFEGAFTVEADLFDVRYAASEDYSNPDAGASRITPYVFGGIGIFNFDPYTHYNGKKVFLAPLKTEGEATPYSLWGVSFPFGIGVKYAISDNVMIAAELNYRKTNTDHIDDVSAVKYIDTVQLAQTNGPLAASLSYRADELVNPHYAMYCFLIKFTFRFGEGTSLFKYGYGN